MKSSWLLRICLWTLCLSVVSARFLFTSPRSLWRGSEEEFCISFHDLTSVHVDYLVTLKLAQGGFEDVIGNATAYEEGRVCHKFKVPDKSGKFALVLGTTAIKNDGDLTTESYREDETQVEIHDSGLETFIQTDKPIYKPGENVRFRAMTINRGLKPWTGLVPLVTVKNPGDVRVMQWKNVENMKGLLSFEMPLSADPPLGVWQITMVVEGKENMQPFTVEEYVLPKYEVTITAPKFLLPITKTIESTVCAKYTYGKPVKGKAEVSVCYEESGGYFYYRYRDHLERPCAKRIININGCETFTVDGSELYLDSANFSRYGNLVINATVTEDATGISLNGTVKGPELTYEAVKMEFKDDTHGYFKEAFPYYARVIVTKPDGSPASGELIEISADNWSPEYHLKRNFTADQNGIVKFAVKNLPNKVNKLTFNARAAEHYQPFRRWDHYVRMYEPRAYHYASKWYSPSNSYIHIPAMERELECGSTLDLDVLYSTPPDSEYNFFVQVLSQSHMVHHTQVRNNFKVHDAVNFDDIPEKMLLDPYTPPPRPTYRYPIDPIPVVDPIPFEDDPELAKKPTAENITVTIDKVKSDDPELAIKPPAMNVTITFEDLLVHTTCTNMYKLYSNTTVMYGSELMRPRMGTTLRECSEMCSDFSECRGFTISTLKGNTTCILYEESDFYTEESPDVDYYERNCYIQAKQDVVQSTHIGKVKLTIPITSQMGGESKLLVYYVRKDKETVASTLTFKVQKCFDNKVEMKFNKKTVYPGNDVTVNLKASPGSLCSVGVVDKSINLLGGNHQLTPELIFGRFTEPYTYTSYWQDEKDYCDRKTNYDPDMITPGYWNYRSYRTDMVDAIEAFRKMNLIVFTDLTLETRPCEVQSQPVYYEYDEFSPPGLAGSSEIRPFMRPLSVNSVQDKSVPERKKTQTKEDKKSVDVRSQFPETWLWDLHVIGDEGEINVTSSIPHTITEWLGNSLCANIDVGVGVSPVTSVTAFQPFFISFTLPYSAIRGEVVPVLVSIFNYMPECLVMQVTIPRSSDFGVRGEVYSHTQCVCPGETSTIKYHVTPFKLGKIKILAAAESIPDDGTCSNNAVSIEGTGANDAVQRELLVEAEGIEKEYTLTSYLCPEGSTVTEDMDLQLPAGGDLVEDSARGYINIIGDIMGPALSNLGDLLRMPYGCGEQNMASFSPNIFALQYLTNTNQLLPKIEDEAKGYMRVGYQRQLRYRHDDGSYSAFGGEGSGSLWLTSFVVKCLGQSRPYIDIDDEDLKKSITWFRSLQLENGCFPKIGYTHSYYLKGGFSDRSNEASLTAFVLISMLEAGISSSDESVVKAVRCLDVQSIPDTYTLTLIAYAYTLYDVRHHKRQQVMSMLEERAIEKDGMKWWSRTEKNDTQEQKNKWYYTAVSAEVEMTGYALLSYITGEQQDAAVNARPIVMWLTKQRNPRGGFSSTQDTIVALQALSRYATLVYQGGVNVTIDMVEKGGNSIGLFNIDDDNTLVLQSKPIKTLPTTLEAQVSGVGCAMVQTNVKFNVYETPTSPVFAMSVKVYRVRTEHNHCSKRKLNICVKFTGPGGISNMAIVDVKMVTGWIPVKDSLKDLIVPFGHSTYIGIEKYELDGSSVHIYFKELDNLNRCFVVDVEQNIELSSPKPAQVKVYDYYELDYSLIVSYDIKTTCGTKEELPYISGEEYDSGINNGEITQVRVPFDRLSPPRIPVLDNTGQRGPPTDMSCPVCIEDMDLSSQAFKAMVCGSKKIYKMKKARKGDYPIKIYANLRTKKKTRVNKFVKKHYNTQCDCNFMNGKPGKIIVFSEHDTYDEATETLALNLSNKIMKANKALEKAIYRLVRKKKCR